MSLAGAGDEAELRALLRAAVIPGAVRVAFTREPAFFAADGLAGSDDCTIVSRDDGRITGMGRLSVLRLMRNGVVRRVGYLAALRVAAGTRESPRLIRDGYELLGRQAQSVDGVFTSIASDNDRARRVLEHGGRLGLPAYRPLCDLVTLVAPVTGARDAGHVGADEVELRAFLRSQAGRAHLSLVWDGDQWDALGRHGVTAGDFSVVRQGGDIGGAAAVWDQRAFRQTVVHGYAGWPRAARPLYNGWQRLLRRPALPAPGSVLAQGALLGAVVSDPSVWARLWPVVRSRARDHGLDWVTVSRDARDPELAVLRTLMRAREYRTTLYEVTWRGGARSPDPWDDRCFRPEASLL